MFLPLVSATGRIRGFCVFSLILLMLFGTPLGRAASPPEQLVAACTAGDLPKARQILGARGRVTPDMVDSMQRTPLLCAVFAKNDQLVAFLLERGADPNQAGRCGRRPANRRLA